MSKKRKKINQNIFANTCASVTSGIISFFLLVLVTVFPLVYDNAYFNILETKYKTYYLSIIGMLLILLVISMVMLVIDMAEYKGAHLKALFSHLHPKNWEHVLWVPDVAVLMFLLIAVISTLQSDYVFESFWGNEGRYTGLFLLLLYVSAYFVISRCWKMKKWCLEVFLISGMIMCIIGITDYFQLDVLSLRQAIKPEQSSMFTSTVGNINTYTAYVALIMGFSASMFATARSSLKVVWYGLCMVISFFAIIMGCSDNAYLALGALFAFLPFFLLRSRSGIRRYLVMAALFVTVVQCINLINQMFGNTVVGLDSLFQVLVNFSGLTFVTIALWGSIAVLYWIQRSGSQEDELGKTPICVWTATLAMLAVIVVFLLYDTNIGGNTERYGTLGRYLLLDDRWGTNRGFIWRKALELYREFTPMHKLFGYGPDTFGILAVKEIQLEMLNATGQVFDNAHNEYLQYLVTIGPIGLAAYVTFLVSSGVRFCKRMGSNPYIMACCVAVLCYGVQALVNLNLPIATPVMWLLLSVGMAGCRRNEG